MKKTLIALASVAALGAAHADVTLYGVIDASFATVSAGGSSDANNPSNINTLNSYASAGAGSAAQGASTTVQGNGRVTAMASGLLQASRWGIKGSENLGQGLKANFTLESALNIGSGSNPNDHMLLASSPSNNTTGAGDSSVNGQMFDRQATVGLSGDFGSIDVGYQINLNGEMNALNDPFSAGAISPLGFYGGLTGAGSSYTGRASNSIKYATTMGQTTVKAFYAMGGVSGNAGAGSQAGVGLSFQATPTLQINLAGSRMNDDVSFDPATSASVASAASVNANTGAAIAANAANAGLVPGLKATYYNSTESSLGIVYQATPTLKVKGGYLTVTQSNPSNPAADAMITANNGIIINSTTSLYSAYPSNYSRNISWIGGTYDLSATSHLTAAYYSFTLNAYTKNIVSANLAGTVTQAYSSNTAQIFAVAYNYDLSKMTDVYVAGSYETWNSPGAANSGAVGVTGASNATAVNQTTSAGTTQTMFAVGLRTRF